MQPMRAIQLSKNESRTFAAHVAAPWHDDGQRFMPLLPTSTDTARTALGVVFPSATETGPASGFPSPHRWTADEAITRRGLGRRLPRPHELPGPTTRETCRRQGGSRPWCQHPFAVGIRPQARSFDRTQPQPGFSLRFGVLPIGTVQTLTKIGHATNELTPPAPKGKQAAKHQRSHAGRAPKAPAPLADRSVVRAFSR